MLSNRNLLYRCRNVRVRCRRTIGLISKHTVEYVVSIIMTCCSSADKRSSNFLNGSTSFKDTPTQRCDGIRNMYIHNIRFVSKCGMRNGRYRNSANISRYPHCSACSIISANGNRRRSAIRKVGRFIFLRPISVYCGVLI